MNPVNQGVHAHGLPLAGWLSYWRMMRLYHRYETEGLENLEVGRSALIVGYHGRAYAHDLCMLTVGIYEQHGYLPHAVFHGAAARSRFFNWLFVDGLGFVTGDGDGMAEVVSRGEHVITTPGGAREGCRPFWTRYQVDWGQRVGYLRVALKYGMPIIPVAATGVDETFIGLNNGYELGKRLGVPEGFPVWLGVGAVGMWPMALPFPAKIRQRIGVPISLDESGPVDTRDRAALEALHHRVTGAVQALLDGLRNRDT
jgi:1-acyl-sn-glycerol-3-phosphate acyltransferase